MLLSDAQVQLLMTAFDAGVNALYARTFVSYGGQNAATVRHEIAMAHVIIVIATSLREQGLSVPAWMDPTGLVALVGM